MKLIEGLEGVHPSLDASVLSVGNFDGVHLGHQAILTEARKTATRLGLPLVVLTFEPHPLSVVAPDRAPRRLATLEEKLRIFETVNVDTAVVAKSESRLLTLSPEAFIREVVIPRFGPVCMVEGRSFGFGRKRAGNVDTLTELGKVHGFEVTVVDPVHVKDADGTVLPLSSSAIRDWLKTGDVARAKLGLGRPYGLEGKVGSGSSRGRALGFPTANLVEITQLIPAEGVYAAFAEVGDQTWPAAISIGVRPTFDESNLAVEAFLLDCEKDLYAQRVRLVFLEGLRRQQKFASADALKRQIAKDVQAVRDITAQARPGGK